MQAYIATIESTIPILFSKQIDLREHPKKDREQPADYDERIWPEKAHYDGDEAVIPAVYFKRALEECAKYLGLQIPGKGKATYTKHFEAGLQVLTPLHTGVKKADLKSTAFSVNADGKRGSGVRVTRRFPKIDHWKGQITILVADQIITKTVLEEHFKNAGMLIGIGSFRLRKGNAAGGFKLLDLKETEL